jgi:hypothetical protein
MRKMLEACPSCDGELEITRLSCTQCDTVILGHWAPCRFCRLTPEHTRLLETFVRCRGNVKEMERELGTSYWTIRKQIDDLIAVLGLVATPEQEDTMSVQLGILDLLDRGEIDATEAVERLARLKARQP